MIQKFRYSLRGAGRALLLAGTVITVAFFVPARAEGPVVKAAVSPKTVEIKEMQFLPAQLTVTVGTTVTWTNNDTNPHTVTNMDKVFRSDALDTKETFSYTFTKPGEFAYFCTIHPMMVGKVIVKPAPSTRAGL